MVCKRVPAKGLQATRGGRRERKKKKRREKQSGKKVVDNLGKEGERKRECVRMWVRGNVKERRGEGGGGVGNWFTGYTCIAGKESLDPE